MTTTRSCRLRVRGLPKSGLAFPDTALACRDEPAAPAGLRGDRFAGLRTLQTNDGIPVLADALTVLACDVGDEHSAGDHTVVIGRIRAVHALRAGIGLDTVSLRMRGHTIPGPTPRRSCRADDLGPRGNPGDNPES